MTEISLFVLLSLTYFTQHDALQFHLNCRELHGFIFILLAVQCFTVFLYHSASLVVGYFGCFHFLAVVPRVEMNRGVHIYLLEWMLLCLANRSLEVGYLGQMGAPFLLFWGSEKKYLLVACCLLYRLEGSSCCTTSHNPCCSQYLESVTSSVVWGDISWAFWFEFLETWNIEHFVRWLLAIYMFFVEMFISLSSPFFDETIVFCLFVFCLWALWV